MDDHLRARLDAHLDAEGLESVWFGKPSNFARLTEGGDNVVDHHSPVGCAVAGYDGDRRHVVTNNIEAPRLAEEEFPDADYHTFEWYEGGLAEAVADVATEPAAADFEVPGFGDATAAMDGPLTPAERERYRSLADDTTAALEATAHAVTPETTEEEAAGILKQECRARSVEAPVALVGGDERAPTYRHYTPKQVEIGEYCLISVTGYRGGQYVSTTRTVAFDAPDWLEERWEVAARVETTALAATREVGQAGGTAGDVFDALADAYAELGWAEEWRNHHQGGATGFAGREWKGTPDADATVETPHAYAWNPTVRGAKTEGTWLVGETVDPLTVGDGPTRTFGAVGYDLELAHPEIVRRD